MQLGFQACDVDRTQMRKYAVCTVLCYLDGSYCVKRKTLRNGKMFAEFENRYKQVLKYIRVVCLFVCLVAIVIMDTKASNSRSCLLYRIVSHKMGLLT
jgi:hypothetical protein